jgi:cyclopropane fatty-acyl-phospholipid synthase-like methyltransferase
VIGVDISRVSIEIAVEKLNKNNLTNLSFITGDICDLKLSEKYDYIVMNDVFEYLSDYELYKIFDKIYDLLDDSSKILLHTPNGYTMWYKSNMFPIPILRQIVRFLRETFGISPGLQIYEQSYINQAHINIKNFYQIKQFFKKYNYKVSVIYDPHTHSYKSLLNKFRSLSMTVILHKKQI